MFRFFRLTLSRDGHGGGIASREDWLVYRDPSDAIAGCSCSSNGQTQCHDRTRCMNQNMGGAKERMQKMSLKEVIGLRRDLLLSITGELAILAR